jgi:hypothetical protein|tara:strand:- start:1203 stop:1727 length:525 start_codon:yes stop_codon:yes gene_type:complete
MKTATPTVHVLSVRSKSKTTSTPQVSSHPKRESTTQRMLRSFNRTLDVNKSSIAKFKKTQQETASNKTSKLTKTPSRTRFQQYTRKNRPTKHASAQTFLIQYKTALADQRGKLRKRQDIAVKELKTIVTRLEHDKLSFQQKKSNLEKGHLQEKIIRTIDSLVERMPKPSTIRLG